MELALQDVEALKSKCLERETGKGHFQEQRQNDRSNEKKEVVSDSKRKRNKAQLSKQRSSNRSKRSSTKKARCVGIE